jgi:hypothetical protein
MHAPLPGAAPSSTSSGSDKPSASCGTKNDNNDDVDNEEEEEEMFMEPHASFAVRTREWGGPRRGGRFPEPTRYKDWERNGRCSDF